MNNNTQLMVTVNEHTFALQISLLVNGKLQGVVCAVDPTVEIEPGFMDDSAIAAVIDKLPINHTFNRDQLCYIQSALASGDIVNCVI